MKAPNLREQRVADIMQSDVVTTTPEATVRELVQLLTDESVSGVPVLDTNGKVQGVVSMTDVVRMAAYEAEIPAGELRWVPDPRGQGDAGDDFLEEGSESPGDGTDAAWGEDRSPYYFTPDTPVWFTAAGAPASQAALDESTVADIMTPVAFTIPADESIENLIRFFLQGHVHRALVVEKGRLLGIVTPFDVMRGVLDGSEDVES
jgi:CBS-domain-containing membrane protein